MSTPSHTKTIASLSGEALWDYLTAPQERQALTKAERKRRRKAQASAAIEDLRLAVSTAAEELSLWKPTARVTVFFRTKCRRCGSISAAPEVALSNRPLVRQVHLRTKATKTSRLDWPEVPRGLPEVSQLLDAEVTHCLECFDPYAPREPHPTSQQLELLL